MKRWVNGVIFGVLIIAGALFLWWQMADQSNSLRLHGERYHMTVRSTEVERQQGLSGTKSLPDDQAMLFVFPGDDKWGIWMKDMNYPIDIVWLDSGKRVVHMVKNAQPSSYPDTVFKPEVNARYVIELASGTIERTGITLGDPAGIPSGI